MLGLTRFAGESIIIDRDVTVTVLAIEKDGRRVRLGIAAPKDVQVWREELAAAVPQVPGERERLAAALAEAEARAESLSRRLEESEMACDDLRRRHEAALTRIGQQSELLSRAAERAQGPTASERN